MSIFLSTKRRTRFAATRFTLEKSKEEDLLSKGKLPDLTPIVKDHSSKDYPRVTRHDDQGHPLENARKVLHIGVGFNIPPPLRLKRRGGGRIKIWAKRIYIVQDINP